MQLQGLAIGVTTKRPDSGPLPQRWVAIDTSDQYWSNLIRNSDCAAHHKGRWRVLPWVLDCSAGNAFGCLVSEKGELHLYHNGRDVGVTLEGLPTDQPFWGFVRLHKGWAVQANYCIPKGEAVVYGEVVCGVMCVSLNICTCPSYFALHIDVV